MRYVAEALLSLSAARWPVRLARGHVRPVPGLYAIYGGAEAWANLGLDPRTDSALYVGKSEDDLVRRELHTHFAVDPTKKPLTGSSTVRRSFAALLRDLFDLHAVPRNPNRPGHFSIYGLLPDGDARLTAWMHKRLSLAVWEQPVLMEQPLLDVEVAIIRRWTPPLNIRDNPRPLPRLRMTREAMAEEASGSKAREGTMSAAAPVAVFRPSESVSAPVAGKRGLTPVELARELGKSPKTIRQALRDKLRQTTVRGGPLGFSHTGAGTLSPRPLPRPLN